MSLRQKAGIPTTSRAIYNPRQGQVKNGEAVVFPILCRELPLFGRWGTDI
jgi:hypothetical protein